MLEIRDIWADYGGAPMLRGVSLDVAAGEVVGLVGPNGSGKTTLVRGVTRVMPLRSGEVRLLGEDCRTLTRAALARRVAVVPQSAALPEGFLALLEDDAELFTRSALGRFSANCSVRTCLPADRVAMLSEALQRGEIRRAVF